MWQEVKSFKSSDGKLWDLQEDAAIQELRLLVKCNDTSVRAWGKELIDKSEKVVQVLLSVSRLYMVERIFSSVCDVLVGSGGALHGATTNRIEKLIEVTEQFRRDLLDIKNQNQKEGADGEI